MSITRVESGSRVNCLRCGGRGWLESPEEGDPDACRSCEVCEHFGCLVLPLSRETCLADLEFGEEHTHLYRRSVLCGDDCPRCRRDEEWLAIQAEVHRAAA